MSRQTTSNDYHERINKVLEYINNHLDESLDLAVLAEQSSFSKFHFHRIMKSYLHEPLGSYVIRLRLELAARLLRYTSEPVNTIAYSCGYETPASFNKAFKKNFNLSPLEFRKKNGSFTTENIYTKSAPQDSFKMPQPKIKHVKEKKMIYIKTNGYSDEAIGPAWEKLVRFMKKQKLFSIFFEAIGISYDDPHITDRSKCRYDACVVVKKEVNPEGEIGFKTLAGGKYAVFRYRGPYNGFDNAYTFIYGKWLPESVFTLRNEPGFEKYLNGAGKAAPEKRITDIYIPVH